MQVLQTERPRNGGAAVSIDRLVKALTLVDFAGSLVSLTGFKICCEFFSLRKKERGLSRLS